MSRGAKSEFASVDQDADAAHLRRNDVGPLQVQLPEVPLPEVPLPEVHECLRASSRDPLAARLAHGLKRAGIAVGSPALVLVSGGADSMALLTLTAALWQRVDGGLAQLRVVTFDHGLRLESAAEAALVVRVATHFGVAEVLRERLHVSSHGNILANAREARLACVKSLGRDRGIGVALLGHHADDRAESMLLALRRGASLEAVAALVPRRELAERGITLVRPLLEVRKAALRDFLVRRALPWCEDPSNHLRSRGAMRREGLGPEFLNEAAASIGAFCDEAQEVLSFRDMIAAQILARSQNGIVSREALDEAHPAVRRAVLLAIVRAGGVSMARAMIEAALLHIEAQDRSPHHYPCDDGATLVIDRCGAWLTGR